LFESASSPSGRRTLMRDAAATCTSWSLSSMKSVVPLMLTSKFFSVRR
jgi:hypothetical protein